MIKQEHLPLRHREHKEEQIIMSNESLQVGCKKRIMNKSKTFSRKVRKGNKERKEKI